MNMNDVITWAKVLTVHKVKGLEMVHPVGWSDRMQSAISGKEPRDRWTFNGCTLGAGDHKTKDYNDPKLELIH